LSSTSIYRESEMNGSQQEGCRLDLCLDPAVNVTKLVHLKENLKYERLVN
jgi:hypothetical protein